MRKLFSFTVLMMTAFLILSGCSMDSEPVVKKNQEDSKSETPYENKEMTMQIGDKLMIESYSYYFVGFIGEDTFVFERDTQYASLSYHKASKSHHFKLPKVEKYEFEVKSFDRDNGTITFISKRL